MAGGKGSGASKSYDYFGDIPAVVCVGQNSQVKAIVADQKEVWPKFAPWKAGVAATTATYVSHLGASWKCAVAHTTATDKAPPNATYWTEYALEKGVGDSSDITVSGYGTLTHYWGTSAQLQDSKLDASGNNIGDDHPNYKGDVVQVLKNFLFGRERTSAPNMQAVLSRNAQQSVITGAASELRDGQANPICSIVELWTSARNGLGMPTASIDATSFQATADYIYEKRDLCYWSPLLTSQTTIKSVMADVSNLTDCWFRFNPATRKLEAGVWKHGVEPVSFHAITLDMLDSSGPPKLVAGGWADAKTGVGVTFTDRERIYKQSSDKVDDQRALTIVGENRRENLQRPYITRRKQAIAHAAETLRTVGRPQIDCDLVVRREHAKSIRPGDWVQFPIELEPGGEQLLQFGKVVERSIPRIGPISLQVDVDETLYPKTYTPEAENPGVIPTDDVPAIVDYKIFVPPYQLSGTAGDVICIIPKRESALTVGVSVWFDQVIPPVTFQNIGTATSFGTLGQLDSDFTDTDTGPILVNFDDQIDIDRLTATISETSSSDDELLLICFQETDGVRDLDDDGFEFIEIMTVTGITPPGVEGDPYEFTVLRARYGTPARTFDVAPMIGTRKNECWLVYRKNLTYFSHASFSQLARNAATDDPLETYAATFLLQPYTAFNAQPLEDCNDISYAWPIGRRGPPVLTWTTPDWSAEPVPGSKDFASSPTVQTFAGVWNDVDGDIVSVGLYVRKAGQEEVAIFQRDTIPTGSITFSESYTFTTASADTWEIIARAVDNAGYVTQSVLLVRVDISGVATTKVKTPYAQYPNGTRVGNKVAFVKGGALLVKCDTASASIRYKAELTRSSTGSPPAGSWSLPITSIAFVDNPTSVSWPGHRIWLKADKAAMTDSDTTYFDIGNSTYLGK